MKTKDPLECWDHGAEITCVCLGRGVCEVSGAGSDEVC